MNNVFVNLVVVVYEMSFKDILALVVILFSGAYIFLQFSLRALCGTLL